MPHSSSATFTTAHKGGVQERLQKLTRKTGKFNRSTAVNDMVVTIYIVFSSWLYAAKMYNLIMANQHKFVPLACNI